MSDESGSRSGWRFPWRWLFFGVVVVLLGGGALLFSQVQGRAAAPAPPATIGATRAPLTQTVSMSGSTVAGTQAKLSFGVSGKLSELNVKVGDYVEAGQVIAKLDLRDLDLAVRQQRAALASAQANLRRVSAGPGDADIAGGVNSVSSAEAQLTKAQGDLRKLLTPPSTDDVARAAADLEKARAELQRAQTAYDLIAWRGDAGSTPQAVDLQKTTAEYNAALAAYNLKLAPPKESDIETARASVTSANQAVDSAKTKLTELQSGAKPDDVAVQRAIVDQTAAALAVAELNLSKATLTAPFSGRVSSITAQPGETVSGAFITLVDMTSLRVEGVVDEQDAPKLRAGHPAVISISSLPGSKYAGKVQSIAPASTVQQGVSTYAVVLSLDSNGEELLAGLSVSTVITTARRDSTLVLPASVIQTQGGKRLVQVLGADGAFSTREITIGISDGINTEIVAGLAEGDRVGLPAPIAVATPTAQARGPFSNTGTAR